MGPVTLAEWYSGMRTCELTANLFPEHFGHVRLWRMDRCYRRPGGPGAAAIPRPARGEPGEAGPRSRTSARADGVAQRPQCGVGGVEGRGTEGAAQFGGIGRRHLRQRCSSCVQCPGFGQSPVAPASPGTKHIAKATIWSLQLSGWGTLPPLPHDQVAPAPQDHAVCALARQALLRDESLRSHC